MYTILCIFLNTGHTFTFKTVKILMNNETELVFMYKAMSDGKDKTATFQKRQICGWSVTE